MKRTNMVVALRGYADSMTSVKKRVSSVHVAATSRRLNGHTTEPFLPHQSSLLMHTTEQRMMTLWPGGMTAMDLFAHCMRQCDALLKYLLFLEKRVLHRAHRWALTVLFVTGYSSSAWLVIAWSGCLSRLVSCERARATASN